MNEEITVPVHMLVDLHWMARRYADGRRTYAPSIVNEITRYLRRQGVELNPTADGTIWARDGAGRGCDRLTDDEAALGQPPDWWHTGPDAREQIDALTRRAEAAEQRAAALAAAQEAQYAAVESERAAHARMLRAEQRAEAAEQREAALREALVATAGHHINGDWCGWCGRMISEERSDCPMIAARPLILAASGGAAPAERAGDE